MLIKFYAEWCGPCKALTMALEDQGIEVGEAYDVDTEEGAAAALKYRVRSLPTLLYVEDGRVIDTQVGFSTMAKLLQFSGKLNGPQNPATNPALKTSSSFASINSKASTAFAAFVSSSSSFPLTKKTTTSSLSL